MPVRREAKYWRVAVAHSQDAHSRSKRKPRMRWNNGLLHAAVVVHAVASARRIYEAVVVVSSSEGSTRYVDKVLRKIMWIEVGVPVLSVVREEPQYSR